MDQDKITFFENVEINDKIQIILRQTDYTEEIATKKLQEHDYDHLKVIRAYLGVAEKKAPTQVKSVNQEIYKQLRYRLDDNMRDYNSRKERGQTKFG
jgi:hypothetical protein